MAICEQRTTFEFLALSLVRAQLRLDTVGLGHCRSPLASRGRPPSLPD
jgi:hypothetical protein